MITCIIFSKDRACQLDLLLRSIYSNLKSERELIVVYKASNDRFQAAYDKLQSEHPRVELIQESLFKTDLIGVVNRSQKYICLFTDDTILYKESVLEEEEINTLFMKYHVTCISLRLGKNTIIQDPYQGQHADMPIMPVGFKDFMVWDTNDIKNYSERREGNNMLREYRSCNFTMMVSLDGHIYERKLLRSILPYLEYYNPNTLETAMAKSPITCYPSRKMACFNQSRLVNNPINIVQETYSNRSGESFGFTVADLNEEYLNGYVIDIDDIDFSNIEGCHQEMEIKLKKAVS